jgi:hypothetical protein
MGRRPLTEIRISHDSQSEKKTFEDALDKQVEKYGFSSRVEFIRFVALNAEIITITPDPLDTGILDIKGNKIRIGDTVRPKGRVKE